MTSTPRKRLAVLLPDGFADWEVGMLTASSREQFGTDVRYLTPGGEAVTSIGGLRAAADGRFSDADDPAFDAVVLCGSDAWSAPGPDVAPLLHAFAARGAPVGVICGATIPAARAGLFAERAHTSNGSDWLRGHVPDYAGAALYREGPEAVSDRGVVSAPGTAPATFAAAMMALLHAGEPGLEETLGLLRSAR